MPQTKRTPYPHSDATTIREHRKELQLVAHRVVTRAVRSGKLAPPTVHRCADCGKKAAAYDHRDYRRPLKVAAVCHRCNAKRGAALPWAPVGVRAGRGGPRTHIMGVAFTTEQLAVIDKAIAERDGGQRSGFVRYAAAQCARYGWPGDLKRALVKAEDALRQAQLRRKAA